MPKVNMKCECGNDIAVNVGDSLYGGILRWYSSYKCKNCGCIVESDGQDEIPSEIREAIIREEGMWGIFLQDEKELVKVMYILRKELGFTVEKIKEVKEKAPSKLMVGTENEITLVKRILLQKGIRSIETKRI